MLVVKVECVQRHIIFILTRGKVEIDIFLMLLSVWLDSKQTAQPHKRGDVEIGNLPVGIFPDFESNEPAL